MSHPSFTMNNGAQGASAAALGAGARPLRIDEPRARLRFSAERARWVAQEVRRPDQTGSLDSEGRYILELPFRDDRELVPDIMRHGGKVEVVGPVGLRRKVRAGHAAEVRVYS